MGCGGSKVDVDPASQARNDQIEKQIKEDRQKMKKEVKILLLGAGESGKSTIVKQMRLIHQGSYTQDERRDYRAAIFSNTVQSMRAILEAIELLGLTLSPSSVPHANRVLSLSYDFDEDELAPQIVDSIDTLWKDEAIRDAVDRSREFQLNDSAQYYFNSIRRMAEPGYLPTDQDVLRVRIKTTGIQEQVFHIGDLVYRMFDVGGQRSERKKWIHCFENVGALIFLVAISEYDQQLYEDESVNRMQEAMTLFESICNSRWFTKTSIILFLNKTDLFRDKLPRSPLGRYFPDYTGGDDFKAAGEYFKNAFTGLCKSPMKKIYPHFTCATDTKQMKNVIVDINDHIVMMNMQSVGMV